MTRLDVCCAGKPSCVVGFQGLWCCFRGMVQAMCMLRRWDLPALSALLLLLSGWQWCWSGRYHAPLRLMLLLPPLLLLLQLLWRAQDAMEAALELVEVAEAAAAQDPGRQAPGSPVTAAIVNSAAVLALLRCCSARVQQQAGSSSRC